MGASLPRHAISFRSTDTYPARERPEVAALHLTEDEVEDLVELHLPVYGDAPHHEVGGFPNPIQGDDMELECRLPG